jgi:hypothetical protein
MKRTPGAQRLMGVVLVVLLVAVVGAQWSADAGRSSPWSRLVSDEWSGRALRELEEELDERSVVVAALRPVAQEWRFAGLREGGAKVVIGTDGWLFYRPGVEAAVLRGAPSAAPAAIRKFHAALAIRGIELLVVVVPNKESVYPEKLGAAGSGRWAETDRVLGELESAGIRAVDLRERFAAAVAGGLEAPLYLRDDSHWSPAGVALAAETIAAAARELVPPGTTAFSSEPVVVRRHGDLRRLLGAPRLLGDAGLETIIAERVGGSALADDAEILVLGDSFLRIFQTDPPGNAGLPAQLARQLNQPVATLVADGGGATRVRQQLAEAPHLLTGKRLVIWEFVERDLATASWDE